MLTVSRAGFQASRTRKLAAKLEREAALAKVGIVDVYAPHRKTPLLEHLEDFRLRDSGRSVASCNHYLTAMKMFLNWMVKDRRTNENPLRVLSRENMKSDRKRERRALSVDEFERLLDAAEAACP